MEVDSLLNELPNMQLTYELRYVENQTFLLRVGLGGIGEQNSRCYMM